MSETVVVASSLDEGSDVVVTAALEIARRLDGRVVAVHTLEHEPGQPRYGGPEPIERLRQRRRASLASQLERCGAGAGGDVAFHVQTGRASDRILELAREESTVVIVLGPHRGPWERSRDLGSTTKRLLNESEWPLLVVKGELAIPPHRVLAPVDLSELSYDSVCVGLGFVVRVAGSERPTVRLLLVEGDEPEHAGEAESELDTFCDRVIATGEVEDEHLKRRVRSGDPTDEIVAESELWSADLVVLGSHGHGGIDRLLGAGSVASAVTARVEASVFLVPPKGSLAHGIAEAILEQTRPDRFQSAQDGG